MIDVENWARIRHMSRVDGLSQRQIAKKLGINRRTVRRALQTPDPPEYGPRQKRPSKLDPYLSEIGRLLDMTFPTVRDCAFTVNAWSVQHPDQTRQSG